MKKYYKEKKEGNSFIRADSSEHSDSALCEKFD